jgi:hypothetical protein
MCHPVENPKTSKWTEDSGAVISYCRGEEGGGSWRTLCKKPKSYPTLAAAEAPTKGNQQQIFVRLEEHRTPKLCSGENKIKMVPWGVVPVIITWLLGGGISAANGYWMRNSICKWLLWPVHLIVSDHPNNVLCQIASRTCWNYLGWFCDLAPTSALAIGYP